MARILATAVLAAATLGAQPTHAQEQTDIFDWRTLPPCVTWLMGMDAALGVIAPQLEFRPREDQLHAPGCLVPETGSISTADYLRVMQRREQARRQ